MKVLSDILHKAGILKEDAEAYSSGGYSVLVRNDSTQRFETVPSSAFTNIYNSDGTLTGNRVVTLNANQLVFRTNQSALQNYTFTLGTPTGVNPSTWPSSVIYEGEYLMTNSNQEPYNTRVWARNQGSTTRSFWVNQVFVDTTAESTGAAWTYNQYFKTSRGSTLDTSTASTNMLGVASYIGHSYSGSSLTSAAILSGEQTAYLSITHNNTGSVTNAYGYRARYYQSLNTNSLSSTVTNFYAFYSDATLGLNGQAWTATLTNFYGLFISEPVLRTNGVITNRWGIYAPDGAMRHHLNGNVLIGTTTDAGYKFDVSGVTRSTTRFIAGSFTPGAGVTSDDKIISDGFVRAAGLNMRSPIVGDNIFIGFQSGSGDIQLWANNANVGQINAVGSGAGSVLRIGGYGYNPGAGASGFRNSIMINNAISPTGNNTADYVMVHLNPQIGESDINGSYTSGSIRGFYYNPSISVINTTTHFAFESTAGKIKVSDLAGTGSRMVTVDSSGVLTTAALPTSTNIYNSDGTLTGNRTVSGTSTNLTFNVGGVIINHTTTGIPLTVRRQDDGNVGVTFLNTGYSSSSAGYIVIRNGGNFLINSTTEDLWLGVGGTGNWNNPAIAMKKTTGNVVIGGTTDAGFKLDVQGTGRFTGNVTFGAEIFGPSTTYFNGPTINTGDFRLRYANAYLPTTQTSTLTTGVLTVNGGSNTVATITGGSGVTSFRIENTGTSSVWYFENKRNAANGSLEISNSISSPTITLFPSRSVAIGTYTETTSAILDVVSTTKGFLPPRMTTTQRNAIASPATGLFVYNTTTNTNDYYNGTAWVSQAAGNIYTADGTLTSNRTINSGGFDLIFTGTDTASAGQARFIQMTPTLVAVSNNDVLVGLDINPTFTNGAFTNVTNAAIRIQNGPLQVGNTSNFQTYINSRASITDFLFRANYGVAAQMNLTLDGTGFLNMTGANFSAPNITVSTNLQTNGSVIFNGNNKTAYWVNVTDQYVMGMSGNTFVIRAASSSLTTGGALVSTSFANGNISFGSTTDAGYKLFVQGTVRISNAGANGTRFENDKIFHQTTFDMGASSVNFGAALYVGGQARFNSFTETNSYVKIGGNNDSSAPVSLPNDAFGVYIGNKDLRASAADNSIQHYFNIRYNDRLMSGVSKAFNIRIYGGQSSVDYGDVILQHDGTNARGNVSIGSGSVPSQRLFVSGSSQINHTYTHTTGNFTSGLSAYVAATTQLSPSYTSGMFYGALNTFYQNEFESSATVPNSVIMASQFNGTRVRFVNTASTITMSQSGSGLRAMANQILQFSFDNAQTSCVVSHVAGSQILAPYYVGSNNPTITNYYGLAINPSDEYSGTLAVTNRWGIYQAGTADNNWFAGKVIIGSTNTVGGSILNVKNLPTSSAGLSSGDIWSDGGTLKVV